MNFKPCFSYLWNKQGEFCGSLVVRIPHFQSWGPEFSPWSGNWPGFRSGHMTGQIKAWHAMYCDFKTKQNFKIDFIFSVLQHLNLLQFSSVAQSCLTLCDPMDRSTPGLPVHHQLPEFTQTHVHRVSDAIQPSHPLSSPSPALNPSQHQGLFQWVNSSHDVAKVVGVSASASVLLMNTQDWYPLGWTGWISLQSKGLSRVFSRTTVQKHQFFGAQLSSQSNSHIHTWLLEKP